MSPSTLLRAFLPGLLCLQFAGCATYRHVDTLQAGPGLEFVPAEIKAHQEQQAAVLEQLYLLANVSPPPPRSPDWDTVVVAGMDYADRKCETYMHALFRLNRDKRTVVSEIGLLGTATAGIMAAAKSAAKDVAMVAIAYGLAGATVDNLSSNLLYDLDPSSVRSMVRTLQEKYRRSLQKGYDTRPAAMSVIRSYAMLCVPASIEAEVNLSVKKADPAVEKGDAATGRPPMVTNALVTVTSDQRFMNDDGSALLRSFVFPAGRVDAARRAQLEKYLADRGIKVSVVSFINGADFAQERAQAAQTLGLAR